MTGGFRFIPLFIFLSACASPQGSLYQRLGGEEGLNTVVDNFLFNIAEQPKILHHFENTDIDGFRDGLIVHLCDISDGPCRYEGDSMAAVHAGMNITAAEFDRLVECLLDAMDDANIDFRAQSELIRRLAVFRDEIVAG